jgi:hypothetical protein
MKHPAFVVQGAMQALQALAASVEKGGVPKRTLDLVQKVCQIRGFIRSSLGLFQRRPDRMVR